MAAPIHLPLLFLSILMASLRCGNGPQNPSHRLFSPLSPLSVIAVSPVVECPLTLHVFEFLLLGRIAGTAGGGEVEGFCSVQQSSECSGSQPLYWKATHPTLAPAHLQDLPGFTRSVYKRDHALITPESHVFGPLPDWVNTSGAYLISPAIGAHFTMYLANMQDGSKSALPPKDVERLVFVLQGSILLSVGTGTTHSLLVDSYAYLPANMKHSMISDESTTLVILRGDAINFQLVLQFCCPFYHQNYNIQYLYQFYFFRYSTIEDYHPDLVVGSTDKQPLLETPGEVFQLRKLLPTSLPYDFNIHICISTPECLCCGEMGSDYGLSTRRISQCEGTQCKQEIQFGWHRLCLNGEYAALGKTKTRYLLYKDVNRNPLI
ncbi:hypothetical protein PR202_gb20852 [Eleusine coracana subsp. coracana]|uniref:Uncharacterized protein n=1 Tax=Eleusine coracana subsp. coracana TaxID=191504 RepID=A0AAV5F9K7_ELECO|nr:hypothetical protein PR202_gb20852 [Eleusine coracana subsp. coracana]